MNERPSFDVCGPLPRGVTVLEASAGTGKTFTIAALAARYVADGTPLAQMLLVTFGRSATGELRARVRERLRSAEAGLAAAMAGVDPPPEDEVLTLLAAVGRDELAERRRRLATALADFDAATITTTHGFCQQVMDGLGVAGDAEPDVRLVEDVTDLVDEVVHDLYLRKFAAQPPPAGFDLAVARTIGRTAVANPTAVIEPSAAPVGSVAAMRASLAVRVRREVATRKRRLGIMTYDDQLTRLDDVLGDPVRGPQAVARLRERFAMAMVDEFQDTDPVQWSIVRRAFGDPSPDGAGTGSTLVLIGDPKQAIYTFRGADVHTYLAAAASAGTTATLDRNWRSDQDLVDALDALLDGAALGHIEIRYRRVRAADPHQQARLTGTPHGAAMRVRIAHRADGRITSDQTWADAGSAQREIAADLAADVVEVLSSPAATVARRADGTAIEPAPLGPGDIAVLVGTNRLAALVRDTLEAAGVPAVINGAGSVFGTEVAAQWLVVLEALERPSAVTRVRAAALTTFLGWSAEQVALADDAVWEDVYVRLHGWAAILRTHGVASLLEAVTRSERLTPRVLGQADGERTLTDLRHVGQLLHHEATTQRLGVTALTGWLRERIAEADEDVHTEDRSRRLDSDAAAVQVLTIHRCKGLEFPIVYCPFLWHPARFVESGDVPVYHDDGRRAIDVGDPHDAATQAHRALEQAERDGEALRLAYVALTRARHQVVLHWASTMGSRSSALARLLFPDRLASDGRRLTAVASESDVAERLAEIGVRAPGSIGVERADGSRRLRWEPASTPPTALAVRPFDRVLDTAWRRTSYSGLTATAKGAPTATVASEVDDAGTVDEDIELGAGPGATTPDTDRDRLTAITLPLSAMPGGARVGTVIHAVLEHTDFAAVDLPTELQAAYAAQTVWSPVRLGPPGLVVDGLARALDTPLGPLTGGRRLRDVARRDRLDELTFELPLAGGDRPDGRVDVADIADLLDRHLPADDPLAGYPDQLRDPQLDQQLTGYLTGSIDAVLRLPADADGRSERYVVVDYKTNWLALEGEDVSAWHYRPAALAAAMRHAHYPLQALLYSVALHRFLRWRRPGYDPAEHLGGVLYLFVRGMIGPDTPVVDGRPCGVFSWRPPGALVAELSTLLDRGHDGRG